MKYRKVNKALAEVFGKGNIELRESPNPSWSYILWFKDVPSEETIEKAEQIVNEFEPTQWLRSEMKHIPDETPEDDEAPESGDSDGDQIPPMDGDDEESL